MHASAPAAAWDFAFVPQGADHGSVSFAYSIPKAGESHDAHGDYTVSRPGTDGTRLVELKVSDHVVLNGFDGNIPVAYSFNLVPIANPGCPTLP